MSNSETWSSLGSVHDLSAQVERIPDDLECLTEKLVESLTPEIDQIIAILRKLQLPLDGIPMPGEEVEEEEEEEEKEEGEEDEEEEEVVEGKLGGRHLAKALIQLCRKDVEKSSTAHDEEEATLYVATIQVLRELEMNTAADCLGSMAQTWTQEVEELTSSNETPMIPSTEKAIPEEPPLRSHRDVLRETLSVLLDRLVITDILLSILTKKSVINQNMVALILGRPNRQQQVAQLLQLLIQLGPYSLQVFIEALTETDNVALANALKWSLRHAPQDVDN